MQNRLIFLIVLFILHLWGAALAHAQEKRQYAGAFMRLGVGPRALALGGAWTAQANSPSALYWNPAGLARLHKPMMMFAVNKLDLGRQQNFISAVLRTSSGAFSLGWLGFSITGIEARAGNTTEADYTFANSENAVFISYAQRLGRYFSVGANLKLYYHTLNKQQGVGRGFDVAALFVPTRYLRIGISLREISDYLNWSGGYRDDFPRSIQAGIAVAPNSSFAFTLDAVQIGDGTVRPAIGLELSPAGTLPLRIGFNRDHFTAGAGLRTRLQNTQLNIDYSYARDVISQAPVHRIAVSFTLPGNRNVRKIEKPAYKAPPRTWVEITASKLNVRSGPGTKYKVLLHVFRGERFQLIFAGTEWCKILTPRGTYGWVHRKYLRFVSDRGKQ